MQPKTQATTTNLLWTGGWDSTFRLLQLLTEEKVKVQPYYVIDYRRTSIGKEFETMQYLRNEIINRFPYSEELFLPTIHKERSSIKPDNNITESYQKILKYRYIGDQYEWLPRYCKELEIEKMELCIEKLQNHNNNGLFPFLYGPEHYPEFDIPNYYSIIKPEFKNLFQFFELPLQKFTKIDMLETSKKNGWLSGLMDKTWFCYRPTKFNNPCGKCKPCEHAIQNNFGWRIPFGSKISRNKFYFKVFLKKIIFKPSIHSLKNKLI